MAMMFHLNNHSKAVLTATVLTLLTSVACVETVPNPTPISDAPDTTAVEQELSAVAGELEDAADPTADEAPAFGSTFLGDTFSTSHVATVDDRDLADDATVGPDGRPVRLYTVMALWGRIAPDVGEPSAVRWNPSLSVAESDRVRVRRTIYFDEHDAVLPQVEPNAVEIRSATLPHVDGVIVQIAITPDDEAGYLAFRSGPISLRFEASELAELDTRALIDDSGNGVMMVALERDDDPACAAGFLGGHWVSTGPNRGVFGGRWVSEMGDAEGHLVGHYANGRFEGKVIGLDGRFRRTLIGTYADGHFRGESYSRDGNQVGTLRGAYSNEGGHGLFRGAWRRLCDLED